MKKKHLQLLILVIIVIFTTILINFFLISANNNISLVLNEEKITEEELNKLLKQASSQYYRGNMDEAQKNYENILNYRPDSDIALKNLYFINKEKGDLLQSTDYLNKIIEIEPENSYWNYKLGVNLFLEGNIQKARTVLEPVYKDYKNNKKEIENTSNSTTQDNSEEVNNHKNNKNIEDNNLEGDIKEYILSEKEFSILCYYLGQIYSSIDNKSAESYFLEGIDSSPHIILNYVGLANLYKSMKDYDKSIKYYINALKKDSSLSTLYPELAKLYELNGNDIRAFYYWKKSLGTGIRTEYAKKRIDNISKKHPELLKDEREKKDLKRTEIKWARIKDYSLDNNAIPRIRVGIVENVNKVSFKAGADFVIKSGETVLVNGKGKESYSIKYDNYKYTVFQNDKLIKTIKSKKPIKLVISDKTYPFLLYDISYGQGYFWAGTEDRQYRGEMEMYPVNGRKFHIINLLNLEEYLFSVVPAEMPAWWPEEAIKAQAIAARSYALSNLGKHSGEGYDLCDTVHCAAYNGVKSETNKTNQLILDTIGEIASYNNKPITAVFSSNSGGYSENSKEIWGTKNSYLTGANNMLTSKYEFPLEPFNIERWLIDEPDSFSNIKSFAGYNIYRWIKVLDNNYFTSRYNLDSLVDIIPLGRSNGGTINKILIKGIKNNGEEHNIEIKGDRIRSALGGLKSNRFTMEKLYDNQEKIKQIIFYGSGWGHNVGMDQTGAAGMAVNNYNYKEIIKHFYKNIDIEKNY